GRTTMGISRKSGVLLGLAIAGCGIGSFGGGASGGGGGTVSAGPSGSSGNPELGGTVTQTSAPPPISGGTLAGATGGRTAGVAAARVTATVALRAGDEPGRVAIDGAGRAHVALRRGGALVTIDLATGTISSRRDVCPAPRGVAYDSSGDVVHVACATGELVTL